MIGISVIVPIYNKEKYLKKAIESLIKQTFKNIEILLIDDGSVDSSLAICEYYKNTDNRIKIIKKSNEGVSSARNVGIEISKGEFITFMDPDDTLELDALEYIYQITKKNNACIGIYKFNTYKNNKKQICYEGENEKIQILNSYQFTKKQVIEGYFYHSCCNKIYSKNIVRNIRFKEDIHFAEDALFNYEILNKIQKIVYSNQQKYNYYINDDGTVKCVSDKRLDILKVQREIYKLLNVENKEYLENISQNYVMSSILIVLDLVNEGRVIKNINLLTKLKKRLKEDYYIIKDIKITEKNNRIYFLLLKISPILLAFLYSIKVRSNKVQRGLLNEN